MNAEELRGIIHTDPDIMGGTPVFAGTRVPLQNLIDCLEGGESVEDFLEAFPTIKREQVLPSLRQASLNRSDTPKAFNNSAQGNTLGYNGPVRFLP